MNSIIFVFFLCGSSNNATSSITSSGLVFASIHSSIVGHGNGGCSNISGGGVFGGGSSNGVNFSSNYCGCTTVVVMAVVVV